MAWLLVLCLVAALCCFWDLRGLGLLDNEGRYAEVAREMLRTGDWITPHLNGEVFLNKPPLLFWLTALGFRLGGMTESVRWVSGFATLLTLLVLYDLGHRTWSARAGLWSAAVYLTCAITVIEARILRPEPFITLFLCVTLWGAVRIAEHGRRRDPGGRVWGPLGLWSGVGLGIMAKGFLSLALPLIALVPALLLAGQLRDWRRYVPGWGLLVATVLVLPWHVAAGLRNEGFWWDYVVNQHVLVFFDRKLPRDHIPDPLWLAWSMYALRLFPWLFLLPAALRRQFQHAQDTRRVADWLPLTWLGSISLFFSLSSGRLEHYFIPAVPAASLLVGAYCDAWVRFPGARTWRRYVPFASILVAGLLGIILGPLVLRWTGALSAVPGLLPLAFLAMSAVTLAGASSTTFIGLRRPAPALLAVLLAFLVFCGCASRALGEVSALTSARYVIRRLDPRLLAESEVAYEAGEEYQLCGVLNFYLGRRVLLPEPPGFVPPTYLQQYVRRLFVDREQFHRDWARGERRYLLFTNPEKPLDLAAEYPHPYYEVARGGGRQVITNLPLR